MISGNQALRLEIDDMRLMPHPVKEWEIEHRHGVVRAIAKYMCPSAELVTEALAEVDALRKPTPAKPYRRYEELAATS